MEIIALAYKIRAKSDSDKSVFHAFLNPSWAGNHIVETELLISREDLLDYSRPLVSDSYKEAHKKAHLTQMSEEEYNYQFDWIAKI